MEINLDLLEVRPSTLRNAGNGCFAATVIPAGTLLGPFRGKYLTTESRKKVVDGAYIWKINDNRYVDAADFPDRNPLRYVNGAKTASQKSMINVAVKFMGASPEKQHVYYMTTRDIPKDSEIIIDYGSDYFKHADKYKYKKNKTT
jgi:hypothetical protein